MKKNQLADHIATLLLNNDVFKQKHDKKVVFRAVKYAKEIIERLDAKHLLDVCMMGELLSDQAAAVILDYAINRKQVEKQ